MTMVDKLNNQINEIKDNVARIKDEWRSASDSEILTAKDIICDTGNNNEYIADRQIVILPSMGANEAHLCIKMQDNTTIQFTCTIYDLKFLC